MSSIAYLSRRSLWTEKSQKEEIIEVYYRVYMESSSSIIETPKEASSFSQDTVLVPASHLKKNIYPMARHILLITAIVFGLCVIVFLIHQNGKSIYDNGL